MPYVNGVRVTMQEYIESRRAAAPVVEVDDAETDEFFAKPKRTRKSRMNIIEAVADVTGADISAPLPDLAVVTDEEDAE